MNRRLKCILLIDDNKFDTFFHEKVVQRKNLAEVVIVKNSGTEAMEFLKSTAIDDINYPELILLDINMPGLSGWDVLDQYHSMTCRNPNTKIFMLTTSINPDDEVKATSYAAVFGFISKPMEIDTLVKQIEANFHD